MSNRFFLRWFASADSAVALAQVGIFSLGHKFGVVINRLVNVPFNSFWEPRRLELLLGEKPRARETAARVCTYATMCSLFLALVLSSGIQSLIEIMAAHSYRDAHRVVPFVALAYVLLGLQTHFNAGILFRRKTVWMVYIELLALAVVLVWNYVFVPRYGIYGAATSNLAGLFVRCTLVYLVSQRLYPIPFELRRIATMFATACILHVVSQTILFSNPYLTFLGRTTIALLFPFALLPFGFYRKGELEFVGQLLRKARRGVPLLREPS
jgi:O-antigen/teichoic acid export membrane protein